MAGGKKRVSLALSVSSLQQVIALKLAVNVFKVGSVKFADSLSIVKKVRTGSKSSQGT